MARVRDISVSWQVMSLYYLNKDRNGIGSDYLEQARNALGPLRVIAQAAEDLGNGIVGDLYTSFGRKVHLENKEYSTDLIVEVLNDLKLPATLMEAAENLELDEKILASHSRGMSLVGEDVGTPIISVNEIAFFGPVISPAPKGEEAGRLFDGILTMASFPGFFELKRTRTVGPIFD
ncbi:MAG: disulfide bond formation protein DsbA [Candidatus Nanopelagicales bacterium]|nr:disulfide bond formation protein DsbA [Candidatus Nanopelagicales bacterium]